MKNDQKIFISSEICGSFRKTLSELVLFRNTELVFAADWVGRSLSDCEQLVAIEKANPTLLITRNKALTTNLPTLKSILFETTENGVDILFLSNLFHIKAFLKSTSKLLRL